MQCSARGIGEREAEEAGVRESNRTSLSSPSWIIFHSGPSFLRAMAEAAEDEEEKAPQ